MIFCRAAVPRISSRAITPRSRRAFSGSFLLQNDQIRSHPKISSSAPAGTRLTGLNILKGKEDPEAFPDDQYPQWLWDLLDPEAQKARLDADPERKARREFRTKMRQKIRNDNFLKTMN
ncbi:mitochondrial 54S ribosomal protein mL54 [Lipomyces oligophaga]|uniref:mitochondrial 54S ribosomal protein mL54 n=1 Tax=Lipomyces oligophaga TaxID=45792 RepID=UPI0034CE9395